MNIVLPLFIFNEYKEYFCLIHDIRANIDPYQKERRRIKCGARERLARAAEAPPRAPGGAGCSARGGFAFSLYGFQPSAPVGEKRTLTIS